jgi:putative FmdB family regulatory protein
VPIYEYRCEACDARFEELVAPTAAARPSCPECGAATVDRVYSSFATEWKPSIVNWHRMPGKW